MTATLDTNPGPSADAASPTEIARKWLGDFDAAMRAGDAAAAAALVLPQGWWRDLLAYTWDLRSAQGTEAVAAQLARTMGDTDASAFILADDPAPELQQPDPDTAWVQAFFTFETRLARGRGFVRLMRDGVDGPWKAWTLLTAMHELRGHEENRGHRRPRGTNHGMHRGKDNWLDERTRQGEFVDADPRVVVVGAGQGGLAIAARLGQLGVDTLVVERNERVGDSWRKRYHSLVLHDPVWYDHLPYLNFPDHWPVFSPKDKIAGWFEFYAQAMELNVWTSAEVVGGSYDKASGTWTVTVRRSDGAERELHPSHVVLATGMSGVPNVPDIPGVADFAGQVCHSSAFVGGDALDGKRALVVGCCNSGHDIAQELNEQGAAVTILQRSSTYVMSSENGIATLFAGTYEEGGPRVEDADLMFASIPYPLLAQLHQGATRVIAELDAELIDGLEGAGFKMDYGDDGSGLFLKYLRRGGGYYIDVGCSALIASGEVRVKQGVEIDHFTRDGVVFTDGSGQAFDAVVLATGYQNMRESARRLLGDEVADQCTEVWGLDAEGELRTIWRRSGHPGFWFMGGNLHQARHYSSFLALQIKAAEEGLIDP